jgi:hypothetical protein
MYHETITRKALRARALDLVPLSPAGWASRYKTDENARGQETIAERVKIPIKKGSRIVQKVLKKP